MTAVVRPAERRPAPEEGPRRALRLVLVTGIYPPDIGGPATHVSDLREELVRRGHRVTVLTLTDEARTVHRGGVVAFPRRWPWPLRLAAVSAWLAGHRDRFDAVYAAGLHPAAVAGALAAGRPVVVRAVADPAWERSVRLGLTSEDFEGFQRAPGGSVAERAMRGLRDWSFRHAAAVVVPSEHLAEHARRWTGRRVPVEVVPNGVRLPKLAPAGAPAGHMLRALFVGRLTPVKRVDLLLEAMARMDRARLDVIGDGPSRGELETLARRVGLGERIRFVGDLPHDEALRRLVAADVLLLASEHEGLPHVVLEAMASGTPVVAPAVGGIPEAVSDGRNGLLLAAATPEAVAGALSALHRDRELLGRLAAAAAEDAARWSIDATVDRIEELLRDATGRPPVVVVGKTRMDRPLPAVHRGRLALLGEHLRPVVVGTGPPRVERVDGGAVLVVFPSLRPRLLENLLLYAGGPALAVALTAFRGGAVVCQSPFEGVGAVAVASVVPRSVRPPVVVEVHGDWRASSRLYGGRPRRALAPFADRAAAWALRRADRVRVVSPWLVGPVRAAGYSGDVDVFPTFTDVAAFLGAPPGPLPASPTAAYAGVLEGPKGVDVLVRAWPAVVRSVPEARLIVAGGGALSDAERERARALGVGDSVTFLGPIAAAVVMDLLDRSTCVVVPSRSEGLPRIVVEAFGRGRPVVASRVGGIPDLVEDGRNGLLVEPNDPDALAAAVLAVLRDATLAARLGDEARRTAERFDHAGRYRQGVRRLADWIAER